MANTLKIGLMGDPHCEIFHDGAKRVTDFISASKKYGADFVIHLGDMTYPNDKSKISIPEDQMPENIYEAYKNPGSKDYEECVRIFNAYEKPSYHVMGNHEFDFHSPESVLELYGAPATYYSFHVNGWHFIVVDTNFIKNDDGTFTHFSLGNQYYVKYENFSDGINFYKKIGFLPTEELEWIRSELKNSDEPVIFFSHYPLYPGHYAIKNIDEFEAVIAEAQANGRDIKMLINGHAHWDEKTTWRGILCHTMNSLSNMYAGEKYATNGRYPAEIEAENRSLKFVLPYKNAVYYMMTLSDDGVEVKGKSSRFVPPTPRDLGIKNKKLTASARSYSYKWDDIKSGKI